MFFDRFDIVEAHYSFCCDYHNGQGSDLYHRLSRISHYFKPGFILNYETLTDNGREIYDNLERKHKECNG
jgi:hypothetical protein